MINSSALRFVHAFLSLHSSNSGIKGLKSAYKRSYFLCNFYLTGSALEEARKQPCTVSCDPKDRSGFESGIFILACSREVHRPHGGACSQRY